MISLTASHIIEHIYCPGFTWFQYVLNIPQYEEKYYKVLLGREIHEQRGRINKEYLRKKIGVQKKWMGFYLGYEHLRGVVDEVLFLKDGSYAPLDYKFAEWNDHLYSAIKIQLNCYAFMIEKIFGGPVFKTFVVFMRSKNRLVETPFTEDDKQLIERSVSEIIAMIETNKTPTVKRNINKCNQCTYRKVCYL
ncbi:CRISPR-associated protein Cas4 [Caldisericum sp.]|uniref:CRISPR-associated protein Cas4 n=1 Tax=Caldisericum sp. TaxID=2499687 RepID=UPI003D121EB9